MRLILGNVRFPDKVRGDLQAQRNANHVGGRRLAGLYREYGTDLIEGVIEEILEHSEKRMRDRIRELPDGTYTFEDFMDDHGPGSDPIRFHVEVTIKGDDLLIDFSGSSDQVPAGINCYNQLHPCLFDLRRQDHVRGAGASEPRLGETAPGRRA